MMEVQWFVELEFKVKLHLTYFIISRRFMKMKVKTSQVQMSVSILEIETAVFFLLFIEYLLFYSWWLRR